MFECACLNTVVLTYLWEALFFKAAPFSGRSPGTFPVPTVFYVGVTTLSALALQ